MSQRPQTSTTRKKAQPPAPSQRATRATTAAARENGDDQAPQSQAQEVPEPRGMYSLARITRDC